LRRSGARARFAFLHGSRAQGSARAAVAAYWTEAAPAAWDVALPSGVDLLVLDDGPVELAGRVALRGLLLRQVDACRVRRMRQHIDDDLAFLRERAVGDRAALRAEASAWRR
jgi:hypothetical protein